MTIKPIKIRRTLYMSSGRVKGVFFVLIISSVLALIIYTQQLVAELRKDARDIVHFYAQTVQRIASDPLAPEALGWFFENVTQRTNFPLILADTEGNPTTWKGINIAENDTTKAARDKVLDIMHKMGRENEPVAITHENYILSYLYYGDSNLITKLVYLPYFTLSALGLLVLTAFLGFSSIKKSEQRFIWVGMAKETAHQLGTPISSLMGWLEVLKSGPDRTEDIQSIANDIETDIKRLEKVAARFSQIGSAADLKDQDIHPILDEVITYFKRRLPHTGKELKIVADFANIPPVALNRDLFEWAVENLIKNSIDAVKQKSGFIRIETGKIPENGHTYIDVSDNGTGIKATKRNDIFKAGYSTKKRGWGLGLNLTKRIIEEYHGGKLFIKETHAGKGTTMRIIL